MMCAVSPIRPPHIPVLLGQLLQAVAPVRGIWVDGTFGAGGYSLGLLEAGAAVVVDSRIIHDPSPESTISRPAPVSRHCSPA